MVLRFRGWGLAIGVPTEASLRLGSRPCSNKSALKTVPLQIEFGKIVTPGPQGGFGEVAFEETDFYLCSQPDSWMTEIR